MTKRLNKRIPKTVEEMMTATTAFIPGETAALLKSMSTLLRSHRTSPNGTLLSEDLTSRTSQRMGGVQQVYSPNQNAKEIFAAESRKFKPPPPMVTPIGKRSRNKFCKFVGDSDPNECVQLRKQIEELVRAGKLLHFIKEISQDKEQQKTGKRTLQSKTKPQPSI
nr:hypothetical protein [Tanacetum cinerariifolium]